MVPPAADYLFVICDLLFEIVSQKTIFKTLRLNAPTLVRAWASLDKPLVFFLKSISGDSRGERGPSVNVLLIK